MGNVHAASSPPPPPPPTAPPGVPLFSPKLEEIHSAAQVTIDNPGPLEELHRKCKGN